MEHAIPHKIQSEVLIASLTIKAFTYDTPKFFVNFLPTKSVFISEWTNKAEFSETLIYLMSYSYSSPRINIMISIIHR